MTPNPLSDRGGDLNSEQPAPKTENPATPELQAGGSGERPPAPLSGEPIEVAPSQAPGFESLTWFEKWVVQNLVPLLVICGGLAVELVGSVLVQFQLQALRPAPAAPVPPAELPAALTPKVLALSPVYPVMIVLLLAGLFAWLAAAAAWVAFPEARDWLARAVRWRPRRPLPALRMIDLAACVAVFLGAVQLAALIAIHYRPPTLDDSRALAMIVQGVGMAAAVWAGVLLARHRARGQHGASGVWPFWRLSPLNPARSVWADVALGAACYPLSLWLVTTSLYFNQYLAERVGWRSEDNPIVYELLARPNPWALAIIFAMATAGAAFFEELIFRGMLYNVLRRYFGGAVSAVAGAALFSAAHRLPAQALGLFVLGLILIWLYERTGRLVASMTFHFVNNLVMLLMVLVRPG